MFERRLLRPKRLERAAKHDVKTEWMRGGRAELCSERAEMSGTRPDLGGGCGEGEERATDGERERERERDSRLDQAVAKDLGRERVRI